MNKTIVTIGGGTGNFVVLSGLKDNVDDLRAIVTMSDSGGSSGTLRDDYGVLPPGDVRQCLVALSHAPKTLRELFLYRFTGGSLDGHNFGNIFLSALEKISGDMDHAVEVASQILNVRGQVIPVTNTQTDLCVELEDGTRIIGESLIDEPHHDGSLRITKAYLAPTDSRPNPKALKAIQEADTIILGPGDVYTSIIPVLLVPGIKEALLQHTGNKVFIMNLMTKFGQTTNMHARRIVELLETYVGEGSLTHILLNNQEIPEELIALYRAHNEEPIIDDLGDDPRAVRVPLLSDVAYQKQGSDTLKRSILRHAPEKITSAILTLIDHDTHAHKRPTGS